MRRCGHLSSRGGRHAIHTTAGSRRSASAASGHVQLPPSGPRPMSRGPAVWPKPALPCIKPLYAPSLMMSEWCGPKAPHECHHPVSAERRRRSWGHPYSNSRHGWWSRRRRSVNFQSESRSSTVTRGTTSSNWRPFARAAGVARGGRNFYRLAAVLAVICAIVSGCGGGAGSTTDSNNSADTLAPLSCSNPAYSGYSSSTCQCARGVASACPSGPDDSVTRERTEPRRPEPPRPEPTPLDVKP